MARKRLNAQPLTVAERSARARTKRKALLSSAELGGLERSLDRLRSLCPPGVEVGEMLLGFTKPRSYDDILLLGRLLELLHGDSRAWPRSVDAAYKEQCRALLEGVCDEALVMLGRRAA